MEWMKALNQSIEFMEEHLLEDISVKDVADNVYMSSYYYQRGFQILTGYSVMEYIRYRRLSLAGQVAAAGREKIIDIAYQYGYDTPESFSKAFSRFHGITPVQARKTPQKLRMFQRLTVRLIVEGGRNMEYRIENKNAFQIVGVKKLVSMDNAYEVLPRFWDEYYASIKGMENPPVKGMYGICCDDAGDSQHFEYYIADEYTGGAVLEGFEVKDIEEQTWAVFPCQGPMPTALQTVNTRIYSEWLPAQNEYEIAGSVSVEMYTKGDCTSADYQSEIWIPVKKK